MLCVAAVYRKMYELNEIQQSAPEEQTSAGLALDGEEVSRRKSTPVKRGTMVSLGILGKRKLRQLSLFEFSQDIEK